MRTRYDAKLMAHVATDDEGRIRAIHPVEPAAVDAGSPRDAAIAYLKSIGKTLDIPGARMLHLNERVSHRDPRPQDVQYRIAQEKTLFDSTSVAFAQTINNLPIWGAETVVTVKHGPNRVISAVDTSHAAPQASAPAADAVARFQQAFSVAEAERAPEPAPPAAPPAPPPPPTPRPAPPPPSLPTPPPPVPTPPAPPVASCVAVTGVFDPGAPGFIVVFKDGTNVDAALALLTARYGFTPTHVYRAALLGFSARLTDSQVQGLRCEETVKSITYNASAGIGH